MSRILHLSDLHFGAVDHRLIEPLLRLIAGLGADATVISGDLTQRARPGQFATARAFIDRLTGPVLVVPGNHDMPLRNLPLRLARPLLRYCRTIPGPVEAALALPDAVVQGVNSANPWAWKAGRLTAASAARLDRAFAGAGEGKFRIAVMHHAPVPAADGTPADMAAPARVLAQLAAAGTDIVLSGHTHIPHAGFAEKAAGILFLQVGTAISTRLRTDANDFALIELAPGRVTRRAFVARAGRPFAEAPAMQFLRGPGGWQQLAPD